MLFAIRTSTSTLIKEIKNRDAGIAESIHLVFSLIIGIISMFMLRIRSFLQGGGFMDTLKAMGININFFMVSLVAAPVILVIAKIINR